jgi:PAS domain S-box-containing protein
LAIEDDKIDQMAFRRFIKAQNLPYDCTVAGSVFEARKILDSEKFDIVITDHSLGDGTAFDIYSSVRDTPLIFVTGSGDEEIAVKAIRAGACDYLIKDPERNYLTVLPVTVESAIRRKKVEDRLRMLSQAVMSAEDCIYITDLKDEILFVNRAFCQTYGYAEDAILGRRSNILWKEESQNGNVKNISSMSIEACPQGEFSHKRKDGSEFPISFSRSVVKDEHGNAVAAVVVAHDITGRKRAEQEREKLIHELQEALAKIKTLSGLLPICASCKKIRDDKGHWNVLEVYIRDHSEADFSHSVCPDCARALYPEFYRE